MLIRYPAVATNRYNYHLPAGGKGRYKASVPAGQTYLNLHEVVTAGFQPQAGTQIVFNFGGARAIAWRAQSSNMTEKPLSFPKGCCATP
jgi:hypothetical protein